MSPDTAPPQEVLLQGLISHGPAERPKTDEQLDAEAAVERAAPVRRSRGEGRGRGSQAKAKAKPKPKSKVAPKSKTLARGRGGRGSRGRVARPART